MRPTALVFALALPLSAGSLEDLRGALHKLTGGEPVKASLEHTFWRQVTEDKKPVVTQGKVSLHLEDGPQGLKVAWGRPLLQQALRELAVQEQDPEKPAPTRTALRNVDALEASESLNHAEALLRDLASAQVVEEKAEAWQGRPARLLVLKLVPRLPENQRKYMKELKADGRLWVGQDGLPLAFSTTAAYKGSRLFITFEGGSSQDLQFARVGSRLVVTRASTEERGSGLGTATQTRKTTTLTVLP